MSKAFLAILALTITGLIAIFMVFGQDDSDTNTNTQAASVDVVASDHVKGSAEAKVTLLEYSDFQCVFCGQAAPNVKRLLEEYPTELRLVYRHFPLTASHPNAFPAARAAEAAGAQGKFFEMHDKLFEKQKEWENSTQASKLFRDYATELGLNMEQFEASYSSASTTDRINSDVRGGQAMGVSATPTFYINGVKTQINPNDYNDFKAKVDAALSNG